MGMETIVILVVAAALSAAVVWWASAPAQPARGRKPTPRPISLRESFQATAPQPVAQAAPEESFILLAQAAPDDRPPRALSVIRLALAITFVALLAVGTLTFLGFLLKVQIDRYLTP